MARVRVKCETKANFWLTMDTKRGSRNSNLDLSLEPGTHVLTWHVVGNPKTPYVITVKGAEYPVEPIERKIGPRRLVSGGFRYIEVA